MTPEQRSITVPALEWQTGRGGSVGPQGGRREPSGIIADLRGPQSLAAPYEALGGTGLPGYIGRPCEERFPMNTPGTPMGKA